MEPTPTPALTHSLVGLLPGAPDEGSGPDLGFLGHDNRAAWLVVAVLLLLWLLSRVTRRRHALHRVPVRRNPVSPEELGRLVFEAIRNQDLPEYRGLFLIGKEAREILGEGAPSYLDEISPERLRSVLADLHGQLPAHAVFQGIEPHGSEGWTLLVRMKDEVVLSLPIGTTVKIGAMIRLLKPAKPPTGTKKKR